jgi:hypothetical protein
MRRKPLSGAIIGILVGLAVAIILTRLGVWPADRLAIFLLPALVGMLGSFLLSFGRSNSIPTMVIAALILVPMLVWGLLGLGQVDENGRLDGGCTVTADSGQDGTNVTDTSRSDPFIVDTDGPLAWSATSPEVFADYPWHLDVIVGGFGIPIDSGTEANSAGEVENGGDVADVGAYASERGIDLDLYRGVYEVGGAAASCDGLGFVQIEGDGLDLVLVLAVVLMVLLIVLFLILYFAGRSASAATGYQRDEGSIDVTGALGPYQAGSGRSGGDDRG